MIEVYGLCALIACVLLCLDGLAFVAKRINFTPNDFAWLTYTILFFSLLWPITIPILLAQLVKGKWYDHDDGD